MKTAAIMVETILGEGGIKEVPDYCLKGLRKLCDEKNILLILDEVQCGVGRTGDFFAFEKSGIVPDIVPIAKGIGGGFPLGACLLTKKSIRWNDTGNPWINIWRKSFSYGCWKWCIGYNFTRWFFRKC